MRPYTDDGDHSEKRNPPLPGRFPLSTTSAGVHVKLVAIGVAPFFDYGGAWFDNEPARQGGDAGLSLRLGPTRAVRGDVAEMAFGYRFGQGIPGKRWEFTVRKGFSF